MKPSDYASIVRAPSRGPYQTYRGQITGIQRSCIVLLRERPWSSWRADDIAAPLSVSGCSSAARRCSMSAASTSRRRGWVQTVQRRGIAGVSSTSRDDWIGLRNQPSYPLHISDVIVCEGDGYAHPTDSVARHDSVPPPESRPARCLRHLQLAGQRHPRRDLPRRVLSKLDIALLSLHHPRSLYGVVCAWSPILVCSLSISAWSLEKLTVFVSYPLVPYSVLL